MFTFIHLLKIIKYRLEVFLKRNCSMSFIGVVFTDAYINIDTH